ncbi:MAG: protoheme IX farnesyltransferase [Elusimicrobia bacterium]|nr:protoheme IX farnesyltransferase [Elusimicrobiota bacterium]
MTINSLTDPKRAALHYFAFFTAACCFFLIIAGGLVTSTGSGLAVPDWPTSFGGFFPRMEGGVFYEHGHRMIAGVVAILTAILAVWLWRREERKTVKFLGLAAFLAVLLQALLGGITVLYELPTFVSVSHACLGQVFFCLLVSIAVLTSELHQNPPEAWDRSHFRHSRESGNPGLDLRLRGGDEKEELKLFRFISILTLAALFTQLFLGAWMRHSGAALAIPDFPLAFGKFVPPMDDPLVRIHFAHRAGAVMVALLILALGGLGLLEFRSEPKILRLSLRLVNLLILQITLGAVVILARKPVWISTAHVAVGALILATAVVLALTVFRGIDVWSGLKSYAELTRPRLTLLVLFTTAMGFYLASWNSMNWLGFFNALLGTAFLAGGASALNQWFEWPSDRKMKRTAGRPIPSRRLKPRQALIFGLILSLIGVLWLAAAVNALTALLGLLTTGSYLLVYTPLKKRTSWALLAGAVPGALPPVMGWAAAGGRVDSGGWLLFGILFFWQIPHFLAIGSLYRDDYQRAGFKMVPDINTQGIKMAVQIIGGLSFLVFVTLVAFFMGLAGYQYLWGAVVLGFCFFMAGIDVALQESAAAARRLFLASVVYLPSLLALLALDRVI